MFCRQSHFAWCSLLAPSILALALVVTTAWAQNGPAAKEIAKVADELAAGKKFTDADAKAFAKKYDDLEEVMHAFKQGKGKPSLEILLGKLASKNSFSAAEKAQLTKIARLSLAIAKVTPHYEEKTKGDVTKKKDWNRLTADMDKGAESLLKAIKAGDGKAVLGMVAGAAGGRARYLSGGLALVHPIGDEGAMEPIPDKPAEAEHEAPSSNRGPVAALVVVLVLVVVGWLLTQALHKSGNMQDCVASGRTNCAPINP